MFALLATWGFLAVAAAGFSTVSELERDSAFCISCHVDGEPRHLTQYQQLVDGEGSAMAAGHRRMVPGAGGARPMTCMDCHQGVTLEARAHLQWIAIKDLVQHVTGTAGAPDGLSRPLPDANCTRCHDDALTGPFHGLSAHTGGLTVGCVECHRAHAPGSGPSRTDPAHLEGACARCHPGLSEPVLDLVYQR